MGFLNRELEVIYAHQEKWDGQGYPYGLKGNDIPYGARILALCDAFEAMTSKRPYRKAPFTAARACEIISGEAGKQLDPALVMPFILAIKGEKIKNKRIKKDGRPAGGGNVGAGSPPARCGGWMRGFL